jgi:hypothetical protein
MAEKRGKLIAFNPTGGATPRTVAHLLLQHADEVELAMGIIVYKGDEIPTVFYTKSTMGQIALSLFELKQVIERVLAEDRGEDS